MAGLDPAIRVLRVDGVRKTWMSGNRPGMTKEKVAIRSKVGSPGRVRNGFT
jgi:hypothetical protein